MPVAATLSHTNHTLVTEQITLRQTHIMQEEKYQNRLPAVNDSGRIGLGRKY
jgi:hypothetical protein